jgi:hypothetical protein
MELGSETACVPVVVTLRKVAGEDGQAGEKRLGQEDSVAAVGRLNHSIIHDIVNEEEKVAEGKNERTSTINTSLNTTSSVNSTEQIKEAFEGRIAAINQTIQRLAGEGPEVLPASEKVVGLPLVLAWPRSDQTRLEVDSTGDDGPAATKPATSGLSVTVKAVFGSGPLWTRSPSQPSGPGSLSSPTTSSTPTSNTPTVGNVTSPLAGPANSTAASSSPGAGCPEVRRQGRPQRPAGRAV